MILNTEIADQIAAASGRIGKNTTTLERIARVREELAEVEAEITAGNFDKAEAEMGDLLLSTVLLCQGFPWKGSADEAYATSSSKISSRLKYIEGAMAGGVSRSDAIKGAKALYP